MAAKQPNIVAIICASFGDAAENLTAAGFRFDIPNPHLEVTFSVLAAASSR
jgi:hypothetical protein